MALVGKSFCPHSHFVHVSSSWIPALQSVSMTFLMNLTGVHEGNGLSISAE